MHVQCQLRIIRSTPKPNRKVFAELQRGVGKIENIVVPSQRMTLIVDVATGQILTFHPTGRITNSSLFEQLVHKKTGYMPQLSEDLPPQERDGAVLLYQLFHSSELS